MIAVHEASLKGAAEWKQRKPFFELLLKLKKLLLKMKLSWYNFFVKSGVFAREKFRQKEKEMV